MKAEPPGGLVALPAGEDPSVSFVRQETSPAKSSTAGEQTEHRSDADSPAASAREPCRWDSRFIPNPSASPPATPPTVVPEPLDTPNRILQEADVDGRWPFLRSPVFTLLRRQVLMARFLGVADQLLRVSARDIRTSGHWNGRELAAADREWAAQFADVPEPAPPPPAAPAYRLAWSNSNLQPSVAQGRLDFFLFDGAAAIRQEVWQGREERETALCQATAEAFAETPTYDRLIKLRTKAEQLERERQAEAMRLAELDRQAQAALTGNGADPRPHRKEADKLRQELQDLTRYLTEVKLLVVDAEEGARQSVREACQQATARNAGEAQAQFASLQEPIVAVLREILPALEIERAVMMTRWQAVEMKVLSELGL